MNDILNDSSVTTKVGDDTHDDDVSDIFDDGPDERRETIDATSDRRICDKTSPKPVSPTKAIDGTSVRGMGD